MAVHVEEDSPTVTPLVDRLGEFAQGQKVVVLEQEKGLGFIFSYRGANVVMFVPLKRKNQSIKCELDRV
jgi:hypothetical protein